MKKLCQVTMIITNHSYYIIIARCASICFYNTHNTTKHTILQNTQDNGSYGKSELTLSKEFHILRLDKGL